MKIFLLILFAILNIYSYVPIIEIGVLLDKNFEEFNGQIIIPNQDEVDNLEFGESEKY